MTNNINQNPSVGYLYPNDKKTERSPDWRGKVSVNGKDFYMSGWNKTKDGKDMITVSITEILPLPPKKKGGLVL